LPAVASHHALSLLRPFLGAVAAWQLAALEPRAGTWSVLVFVLVAIATDVADGRAARASGNESTAARFIDNVCDATFLLATLSGFAIAAVWSDPSSGSATSYSEHANWLPVIALLMSFGVYLVRSSADERAGRVPVRSPRGHAAGVANYALVLLGAVAVVPPLRAHEFYPLTRWLLEPAFVTVALLNFTSITENLLLLFPVSTRRD